MVKHCRTKRHIKIKSYEKAVVAYRENVPLWFREGEGGEIMGVNQHFFENLLYMGQGAQAVAV